MADEERRERDQTEDVRRNVAGGPASEVGGDRPDDDTYRSRQGAEAATSPPDPPARPADVTVDEDADPPVPDHVEGAPRGEEVGLHEQEAGRKRTGETGAGRPAGTRSAEDSTGVSPERMERQDPDSPPNPPG